MVEIVNFLAKRARKERKGWLNWPIGMPIQLGDVGRTSRRLFTTEREGSLSSLGIPFTTTIDPSPDLIDWQYAEDKQLELFVKATANGNVPAWSSLGPTELGFSAKFGSKGSYRVVAPELRWNRIEATPELKAALREARRNRWLRRRDRIVVGVGQATSYTMLMSISDEATIDFTAKTSFRNIADLNAGFTFKRSRGAVERYVAAKGGVLFLRLARALWSGEMQSRALANGSLEAKDAGDDEIHLVEADPLVFDDDTELD